MRCERAILVDVCIHHHCSRNCTNLTCEHVLNELDILGVDSAVTVDIADFIGSRECEIDVTDCEVVDVSLNAEVTDGAAGSTDEPQKCV